jgi:hypothetical protein
MLMGGTTGGAFRLTEFLLFFSTTLTPSRSGIARFPFAAAAQGSPNFSADHIIRDSRPETVAY